MNEYITVEDIADSLNKTLNKARQNYLEHYPENEVGRGHFLITKSIEEATSFTGAYQIATITLYYIIKNQKFTVLSIHKTDKAVTEEHVFFLFKTTLKELLYQILSFDIKIFIQDEILTNRPPIDIKL